MTRIAARVASVLAALSLALLWAVVLPSEAHACSCSAIGSRSALERADAVFSGRVLSTERVRKPPPGRHEIRFQVSRVYKGDVYAQPSSRLRPARGSAASTRRRAARG